MRHHCVPSCEPSLSKTGNPSNWRTFWLIDMHAGWGAWKEKPPFLLAKTLRKEICELHRLFLELGQAEMGVGGKQGGAET